jgi:hypothetical protein
MIEEPGTITYYYIFAKKEGIGQPSVELYYTLAGKLIKKVSSEEKSIIDETEKADNKSSVATSVEKSTTTTSTTTTTSEKDEEITNSVEKVDTKELPSTIISYIKTEYKGYTIKEAVLSTTDEGTFYYVKVKKEGVKAVTELGFDISGKFVEPKNE